jgi:hypothetical protein
MTVYVICQEGKYHLSIPQRSVEREVTFCVWGVISPVLSNLYRTEVDRMLERAQAVTRFGKYTAVEYARFADDRAPRRRREEARM